MIQKIVKKIVYNVLWILYPITYIVKREPHTWVFGNNFNMYNDNSKYLFEYVSIQHKNINAIWITGDRTLVKTLNQKGLKSLWRYSFKGMMSVAKSGVFVYSYNFTDINMWLKRGALKLNLWHGIPLKKIGADIDRGPAKKLFRPEGLIQNVYARLHSPQLFDRNFYLLATSDLVKTNFSKAFEIPLDRIIIEGYPRLLPFFEQTERPKEWMQYDDIVIYMPTFRDGHIGFPTEAIPDPSLLNDVCSKLNMLFLLKLHPITPKSDTDRFKGFSNLKLLDNQLDIHPLLQHTSALITDYSSIFIEYAILNKPTLIYAYDLEYYTKNLRDMYYELDELTQGKQIGDYKKLLSSLSNLKENSISTDLIKSKFWQKDSLHANSQITKWILAKLAMN